MLWPVVVSALLLSAAPDMRAATLAGEEVSGSIVKLNAESVTLATAAGERTFAATSLLSLKPASAQSAIKAAPTVWIQLIDGSELLTTDFTANKGRANIVMLGGGSIEIFTRSIRSVRLKDHESDIAKASQLAEQWQEIVSGEAAGDVIVIRKAKGDKEEKEATLDQLEGVINEATGEKVHFTYDGQAIPVDRAKVEGLLYFHPAGRELPDPVCRVDDAAGNRWNAKSLALAGETLTLVTTSGIKHELPLADVRAFDYSAGKIVFLSDLDPETTEFASAFGASGSAASLAKLFAPRQDRSFDGDALELAGKTYDKGLAIHSRTLLEYRLGGKYTKFFALAGLDPKVRPAGDVNLKLSLDGKLLGELRITGKDASPVPLEYDVRGGRKLSILVDFGGGLDLSDRLHLVNARVTK